MTAIATEVNQTSFARHYAEATAKVLDALWHIGTNRFIRLEEARVLLEKAEKAIYRDSPEETVLVKQLQATLNFYAQRGLDA